MLMKNSFLHSGQVPIAGREIVRASLGACLGIAATGFLSSLWFGHDDALVLIPPMGASAVLLLGVPASPFAQPAAVIGGNLLAALIGVTCAQFVPMPLAAAALAVAGTMAAMAACRCVHPPSGAIALVAVLGGPAVRAAGYGFVLMPVLLNTMLLVAMAVVYNRATGRTYPHRAHAPVQPHGPRAPVRLGKADFEAAIADYGETLVIDADDLERLFEDLQARAGQAG